MNCATCPEREVCTAVLRAHRRYCELHRDNPERWGPVIARQSESDRAAGMTPPVPRPVPAIPLRSAPPQRRAVLRTFLNDYSGFGRFGVWIGKGLESAGVPVAYDAICTDEVMRPVGEWQRSRAEHDPPEPWRLLAHYLGHRCPPGRATVYYTMHETSRILPGHAQHYNEAVGMVVPCTFNAEGFRASGVTVPIKVVPAGVAACEGFVAKAGEGAFRREGPFRVLFAAMLQHGGCRKGHRDAIEGFVEAFPRAEYPDAELVVKVWPTCVPFLGPMPRDPRIKVVTDALGTKDLADLYRGFHVLLAPTRGEGWGLHTLEAMACGCVPIVPIASGTAEFADGSCAYGLDFDWRPAESYYAGMGDWHVPRRASIVAELRRAYRDRDGLAARAEAAVSRSREFTWERTGLELRSALQDLGMLARENPDARHWPAVLNCPHRDRVGCGCSGVHHCRRDGRDVTFADCLACVKGGAS